MGGMNSLRSDPLQLIRQQEISRLTAACLAEKMRKYFNPDSVAEYLLYRFQFNPVFSCQWKTGAFFARTAQL
jgi:hypothetical protein